jgi:hypothetical protein
MKILELKGYNKGYFNKLYSIIDRLNIENKSDSKKMDDLFITID